MPRLVIKSGYIKGGGSGYLKYIATREGVEKICGNGAPTGPQQKLIADLLRDFPDSNELFEYEDYQVNPTISTASAFITAATDYNVHALKKGDGYMKYITTRPRAEQHGGHGLFSSAPTVSLDKALSEEQSHAGNEWTFILSPRREDATRLGYDSAAAWRQLLMRHSGEIATAMKIPYKDLRWYAAFHDEGHHPHVHMMAWSSAPKQGYLTKDGIKSIRSKLTNDIFQNELQQLYQRKDISCKEVTTSTRKTMGELISQMASASCDSPVIEEKMRSLADDLSNLTGKKVYGYLPKFVKEQVDDIVKELAKLPQVAECYEAWNKLRDELENYYKVKPRQRLPLSQQKEFKSIKNMVIQEALRLGQMEQQEEQIPDPPLLDAPAPEAEDTLPEDNSPPDYEPKVEWSEDYKLGRVYLYGSEEQPPDFQKAHGLFLREAERGNALAMCDLSRMYADGLGRERDPKAAQEWYAKALEVFQTLEDAKPSRYSEYRIGKLYAGGLGTEQDYSTAADWFGMAAEQGHKYAQYSLAGLFLRGQEVTQSDKDAYRLYSASARQGFPYAAYELAKLLRDGRGCEQNSTEAERWFYQAYQGFFSLEAQSHDDKLQYRLGWMKLHGVGTEQNKTEARDWFEKSAQLGNPNAQYQLAILILADENPNPAKVEKAVAWLTQSAKAGQDCAQYALGKLYRDGRGVEKDIPQAVIWFSTAAEQDNSYAAYALGKLYLTGEDAPKNVDAALRWLQHSADLGNQYAQYQLSKLYLLGCEIEKDENSARQWLTRSAAQGNEYAQWFLDHWGEFHGPTPFQCATRLLYHLSRVFQENSVPPTNPVGIRIDSKRRKQLMEKRLAMGHKPDDHEQKM